MSSQTRKSASIAVAVAAIFFTGFFLSYLLKNGEMHGVSSEFEKERLRSERLLSEKLEGEKKTLHLSGINGELEKQNSSNLFTIDSLVKKIKSQQGLIADAVKKNKLFVSFKKQISELETERNAQSGRIKQLETEKASLENSRTDLNNTISSLTTENKKLKENNELMSSIIGNNILVEATKGKRERLTVKAGRTNKLQATFDLPQGVSENLSFKVTGPNGKVYRNNEKNVITYSYIPVNDDKTLVASVSGSAGEAKSIKRVKLIFRPAEKLKKGIYTIEVMNTGTSQVGKIQVRLK